MVTKYLKSAKLKRAAAISKTAQLLEIQFESMNS